MDSAAEPIIATLYLSNQREAGEIRKSRIS
jgi:hypothetical protein